MLRQTLRYMRADYARLSDYSPGPEDIDDYGIGALWASGIDGAGTTVALLEGWNDPRITRDLSAFDAGYRLPAARISTIYPAGPLPRTCPRGMEALGDYGSCSAWSEEIELDAESVHLIAPYARILLVAAPADTTSQEDAAEDVAPPEMQKAVEVISAKHLANVISVSDGSGETTYRDGKAAILAQDPGELSAAANGIPLLAATGDCGVVQQLPRAGRTCEFTTDRRSVSVWADSPWVTAVGGSIPNLNAKTGARLGRDGLWHDRPPYANAAGNAGLSAVYARPGYQAGVASITHSRMRSLPDITMDATDGTSESAPLFAGVLALATQENGDADLGPINPALYAIGPRGAADGIADVTSNNDSFEVATTGRVLVRGYTATRGFDIASGWGTVNAARFVPSLVAETRRLDAEAGARRLARSRLTALGRDSLRVTVRSGARARGERLQIHAGGLLPDFPVRITVGGAVLAVTRAAADGDLRVTVDVPPRDLSPTSTPVALRSLLITETAQIRSP